jgi:DNA polymerase
MTELLHRDLETRSAVDLPKVGAWRYARDPTTSVLCVSYAVNDGPVQLWKPGDPVPPPFIDAARDSSWVVVAHNDSFETAIETCVLHPRHGWPLVPLERHRCSAAMARANAYPGALEKAAVAAGIPQRKDRKGHAAMLRLCRPRKPRRDATSLYWHEDENDLALACRYCCNDTDMERALYKTLPPLSDAEQAVWILDQVINARGFRVDVPLGRAARDIACGEWSTIGETLAELTGGKITSPFQVKRILPFLQERGHQIKSLSKRAVGSLLAGSPSDEVRQLLELRRDGSRTAAKKFDAMLAGVDTDERLRTNYIYCGCGTGRWSAGGNKFQAQNLVKRTETKDIDAAVDALLARDLDRIRAIGAPIIVAGEVSRAAIIAAPGHDLLGADFSAIESRVLAWLADETWKLEAYRKFDETGDPQFEMYCVLASRALKREVTPADEAGRGFGKTFDLAFGFGGGAGAWRKFDTTDTYSDAQVEEFKNAFRREHPATVRFWNAIEAAAMRALRTGQRVEFGKGRLSFETQGTTLYLTLPSGRRVAYPEARFGPGKFEDGRQIHFKDNGKR